MDSGQRGALLFFVCLMAAPLPALAYLDPVTGSFVVQGLIAGVLAVVASLRSFRERLRRLFTRRRPDPPSDDKAAPPPDARPPDA